MATFTGNSLAQAPNTHLKWQKEKNEFYSLIKLYSIMNIFDICKGVVMFSQPETLIRTMRMYPYKCCKNNKL